ncbi:MAG: T9SS type A sorting domain-containing protein [Bacteroidales bacterium]|nr:T9SS type A sorting domain-containing protein [Bacteroidales bacterium]
MNIIQPGPLETPSICMVSVDPETEKNVITWEESSELHINKYQVWKAANIYYLLVAETAVTGPYLITDWKSEPVTNAYKYVLISIDTCGNASQKSPSHKPFLLKSGKYLNNAVDLTWQPYLVDGSEYVFISVVIFRGSDSSNLLPIDTIESGNETFTYSDANPPLQKDLFYRIAGLSNDRCNPGSFALSFSNLLYVESITASTNLPNNGRHIEIYPNPMETEAKIVWYNPNFEPCSLSIYDLKGTLIQYIPGLNTHEYQLSRGNMKSGCYIIELKGSDIFYGRLLII